MRSSSFRLSKPPDKKYNKRVILYLFGITFLIIVSILIGYMLGFNSNTTLIYDLTTNQTDLCDTLSNVTFRSVDTHERGLGADGHEAMGYWTISFNGTTVHWLHSDYEEKGTYT